VTIKFTQAHGELYDFGTHLHLTSLVDGVRSYTLTGTADELDGILHGLMYNPRDGFANTTVFDISVQDAEHMPVTNAATVVTTIEGGGDPTSFVLSDNAIFEVPYVDTFIGEFLIDVAGDYVFKIVMQNDQGEEVLVDSDGIFQIENNRLVNTATLGIDYEQTPDYNLTIRVMRAGQTEPSDWHLDQFITVTVIDIFGETTTGTGADEVILGDLGRDTLDGGGGSDTLAGGAGRDDLTGGTGNDFFRFDVTPVTSSRDVIRNFTVGEDQIQLSAEAFRLGTALGDLAGNRFVVGTQATTDQHRIIYDMSGTSGRLLYDADGARSGLAVEIATFRNSKPVLRLEDFDII
jgi:Ca2+-binding RTX toxin-like protein